MDIINTNIPPLDAFHLREIPLETDLRQPENVVPENQFRDMEVAMEMDTNPDRTFNDNNEMLYNNYYGSDDKRKFVPDDDLPEAKKPLIMADEKKIIALRKNIRDVMDENQLDTTTIAAQREESERLARVAEQQKIIREYQRQTAVNRQFVRTQNRVLSLLQSGNTFAKITDVSTRDPSAFLAEGPAAAAAASSTACDVTAETTDIHGDSAIKDSNFLSGEKIKIEDNIDLIEQETAEDSTKKATTEEVVTIEDSSSEDDCILLSDDEDEADVEEDNEEDPTNSGLHVKDAYNVPDEHGRVVVNIGHPEGEEDIFIAPQIARTIKPHQIGGVRFLYDNIIESTKRFKSSSGFGCILAHSMGLGKTLQVVCFCDIFLRHTNSKTILCVMPINTLQNWVSEFNMWLPRQSTNQNPEEELRPRNFDVYVLNDQQKTLTARAKVILKWANEGGVLLIGYELFRLLALKLISTRKRRSTKFALADSFEQDSNKNLMDSIHQALVKPGPDLVICDEGHRIKNAHAGISLALKQIRTRRRIVLTGYPLQNNLLEYWCMVDFVRPNYLGTRTEFCNMFERPIQNGQCSDSTPEDIKLMRYRAHVLHSLLVGFVQRRSHVVLQQTLPQKIEFVILTKMTPFQKRLYDTFMNDIVRSKAAPNPLKAFSVCCKIWNHPDVLYNFLRKRETDLDLEIYENEGNNDSNAASTAAAAVKNKPPEANPTKMNSEINLNNPLPDTESHRSNANNHPITQGIQIQSNEILTSTPPKKDETFKDISSPSPINKHQNLYYFGNCYQSNNETLYPSDCNENNYWQDTNATYFGYPPVSNNISYPFKPNYVEIVNEKSFNSHLDDRKEPTSSEIVDLDTKEIKTMETNIIMEQNQIPLNESANDVKSDDVSLSQGPSPCNTQKSSEQSKEAKPPEVITDIKDILKVKTDDGIPYEWAIDLMKGYRSGVINNSPKMEIFFCILNESIQIGDRVLLFSQSLLTLNLIESFLQASKVPGSNDCWIRGHSYFRLDGSTTSQEREKLINEFNNNFSIKLFLISTRAGSLGINLVGANRVVIFDASWNPCHDTQAVYRIYRYGQQKPCFVYRIVMDKCLEKKIYDRQIKKQGMSDRVVDECNPEAHLSLKDVTNLCHDFDEEEIENNETFTQPLESFPDEIIRKILQEHKSHLSKQPFHHDSLLVDHKEKKLSQAEKRQAHRGYEMEKKASTKQNFNTTINKFQYRIVRSDGTVVNRPVASIRPMQSTKTGTNVKTSGTSGVRSTRWIPAEVWQRQGMTAQEMTLPLDVVIPTNSSDKANIILKAGQRVMVLKSAKGIYMQLDSGKIIAIRTQNKTPDQKFEKPEVIDITSEEGNATDVSSLGEKSNKKMITNTSHLPDKPRIIDIKIEGKKDSSSIMANANAKFIKEEMTAKESLKENQIKAPEPPPPPPTILHQAAQKIIHPPAQNTQNNYHAKTSHYSTTLGHHIPSLSHPPPPALPNVVNEKNNSNNFYKPSGCANMPGIGGAATCDIEHKEPPPYQNLNDVNFHRRSSDGRSNTSSYLSYNSGYMHDRTPTNKTLNNAADVNLKPNNMHTNRMQIKYEINDDKNLQQQRPINNNEKRESYSYEPPKPYNMNCNNMFMTPSSSSTTQQQRSIEKAGSQLAAYDNLSHVYKEHNQFQPKNNEYVAMHQSPLTTDIPNTLPSFPSSQKLNAETSDSSSMHFNLPVAASLSNVTIPSSQFATGTGRKEDIQQTSADVHYSSRETSNYPHSQYYGNFYERNNLAPATANYETQFVDYSSYGSYTHPHFRSHFHGNVYNTPQSAISSNPYTRWPPFMPQSSISEPCNVVYSTSYAQNGSQYNQWHNQR